MAQMSLRPAFVLAVLLSLTCGAIAGRHLLQTGSTYYQATSTMTNLKTTASCTLNANVTTTVQTTNFTIRVSNAPAKSARDFTNPKYINSKGAIVAEFVCIFTVDPSGVWSCNVVETVSLIYASQPTGTLKTLIAAGLFNTPSALTLSLQVLTTIMKGTVSSTVTDY